MSIFKLLGLGRDTARSDVRRQYVRRLLSVHPDRSSGSREKYAELVREYERYMGGETDENSYCVCSRAQAESLVCRCGGLYRVVHGDSGRIECEYCSCFIEVMDDPAQLLHGRDDAVADGHRD